MKRVAIAAGLAVALILVLVAVRTVLNRPDEEPIGKKLWLNDQFPEAPDRLASAIRFRTISRHDASQIDSAAFLALHDFLRGTYTHAFESLQVETISDLSLLLTWVGSSPELRPALVMGHLDVVPAGNDSLWSEPPFAGSVAADYVWGRGALDDKIGVIAALEAVDRLIADGFVPRRTLYMALGHDEEVGGSRGAAVIADTLMARLSGGLSFVIDEGGFIGNGLLDGLDMPVALVGTAEKGYLTLELSTTGAGGHSSAPPDLTQVGRISRAVTRLAEAPFPARIDGATRAMFDHVGPYMAPTRRVVFANLWLFEPLLTSLLTRDAGSAALVRTTTAATMIDGGVKENVLPTSARAVVNFRILPGETTDTVTERVIEVVDDARVEIRPINVFFDPSPVSSSDSEAFQLVRGTIHETTDVEGLVVTPFLVPGATDSRYFTPLSENVYRFLPIVVGRDELETIHGAGERIRVENVRSCAAFLYRLIQRADGTMSDS